MCLFSQYFRPIYRDSCNARISPLGLDQKLHVHGLKLTASIYRHVMYREVFPFHGTGVGMASSPSGPQAISLKPVRV